MPAGSASSPGVRTRAVGALDQTELQAAGDDRRTSFRTDRNAAAIAGMGHDLPSWPPFGTQRRDQLGHCDQAERIGQAERIAAMRKRLRQQHTQRRPPPAGHRVFAQRDRGDARQQAIAGQQLLGRKSPGRRGGDDIVDLACDIERRVAQAGGLRAGLHNGAVEKHAGMAGIGLRKTNDEVGIGRKAHFRAVADADPPGGVGQHHEADLRNLLPQCANEQIATDARILGQAHIHLIDLR